jgi:hypothetical protein
MTREAASGLRSGSCEGFPCLHPMGTNGCDEDRFELVIAGFITGVHIRGETYELCCSPRSLLRH